MMPTETQAREAAEKPLDAPQEPRRTCACGQVIRSYGEKCEDCWLEAGLRKGWRGYRYRDRRPR